MASLSASSTQPEYTDVLFTAAVKELPAALQEALKSAGLCKASLLKTYPRASPAALGLAGQRCVSPVPVFAASLSLHACVPQFKEDLPNLREEAGVSSTPCGDTKSGDPTHENEYGVLLEASPSASECTLHVGQGDTAGIPTGVEGTVSQQLWSDTTLLYLSLVQDGALPEGFQTEFEKLGPAIESGSARELRKAVQLDNVQAAVMLHEHKKRKQSELIFAKTVIDQFALAATVKPKRFATRLQASRYQGPSARRDAEQAERARWISALADLLRGSPTPMGAVLTQNQSNTQLLGGGRRVSTVRSRVRALKRFFSWLAIHHESLYPTSLTQLTDFLRVRLSEPCNRGALKGSHQAFIFLEEIAGVPTAERFTASRLYNVVYRELLSTALPGKPLKQAPRMLITMLSALERLVLDSTRPQYFRIFAWWVLIQNWATLRFSDHRGLSPDDISFHGLNFSARLTRSKTLGCDKAISSRMVVVDACCFLYDQSWLKVGWELLKQLANFERDYLMPSPSSNYFGCRHQELKYDTAYALLSRVLLSLSQSDESLLPRLLSNFWTPHSGRAFLPSAATVIGFSKEDRDYLGGWSAQGSDRYARVAIGRISNMQKSVISAIHAKTSDPLGEDETLSEMETYLLEKGANESDISSWMRKLSSGSKQFSQPVPDSLVSSTPESDEILEQDLIEIEAPGKPDKRRKGDRSRYDGTDPKTLRLQTRSELPDGFYISRSGKKRIRTLHQLGSCFMVPGVDYLDYIFLGRSFPHSGTFDNVCKQCAKKGVHVSTDSSATETSSSTSEEEV